MDFDNPEQLSLRGSLILADPSLTDPGFARSVLLLTEHSHSDGAMGFILNKPIGRSVGDLVNDEEFPKDLAKLPAFLGGPVSPEQLTFASLAWNAPEQALDFCSHLSSEDAVHRLNEGFAVRAFVGYSGWSGGQLESELKQRAWITSRPEQLVVDANKCDSMWNTLLTQMGPWYRLLASTPDDPSLN